MALGNSIKLDTYVNDILKDLGVSRDGDVTEIYLGKKRGLESVQDFMALSRFRCLRSLWLNGNGIRCIPPGTFKSNCVITELYLHDNLLSKITDLLRPLTCIEILTLNNNQLASLVEVSRECKAMQHLQQLRLSGNPLAQQSHYRLAVIHSLKSVRVLDHATVENAERESSIARFQPAREKVRRSISFGTRTPPALPEFSRTPRRWSTSRSKSCSLPPISPRLYRHKPPAPRPSLSPPGSPKDKEQYDKLVRKRSWMEYKTFDWSQWQQDSSNHKTEAQTVTVRFR